MAPLTRADRDLINADLHAVLEGEGAPPDYVANKTALAPLLTRLAQDGWIVEAWDSKATLEARKAQQPNVADWSTAGIGGVLRLRRTYRVIVTRDPDHQALVVDAGEVAPGDNTYSQVRTEFREATVGIVPFLDTGRTADDPVAALALLIPGAHAIERPEVREEDLT